MPLKAIDPLWINAHNDAPEYDAEELRRNLGYLLAPGDNAGVSRSGVLDMRGLLPHLSGSDVWVPPGGAVIGTSKGAYVTGNKVASKIDALAPADATNPRRDRIVLVILDPDNGAPSATVPRAEFRIITGTPSATAQTGGGYPPAPSGVAGALTLGWVDVPKEGAGAPVITDQRRFTAAAGAPIPVRNQAERDAIVVPYAGLSVRRMDLSGTVEVWAGRWVTSRDWVSPFSFAGGWSSDPSPSRGVLCSWTTDGQIACRASGSFERTAAGFVQSGAGMSHGVILPPHLRPTMVIDTLGLINSPSTGPQLGMVVISPDGHLVTLPLPGQTLHFPTGVRINFTASWTTS